VTIVEPAPSPPKKARWFFFPGKDLANEKLWTLYFSSVVLPNSCPLYTEVFFPCHARTTMGLPMDADPELLFFNLISSLIVNF